MTEKRICLGAVTRPHGVRGEVCVEWYADEVSYLKGDVLLEYPDGTLRSVRAKTFRQHKNGLLVSFAGVDDRNAAEYLRGATVWIPRDELPDLPEGAAYLDDLIGSAVTLADGTALGVLHHIEVPPGQLLWAIRDADHEVLFPAREEFIVSLEDPIVIDPPEGLVEACRTPLR